MLTLLLCFLAGIIFAVVETVKMPVYFKESILANLKHQDWWNETTSYNNRWKLDKKDQPIIGDERFLFSSTFLVFLTDAWHFFQSLFLTLLTMAIISYEPILYKGTIWYLVDFLLCRFVFGIGFTIFWSFILPSDNVDTK